MTITPTPEARNAELLPCPFCGKQPTSRFYGDEDGGYWGIDCQSHAQSHQDSEAHAIGAWNTRASLTQAERPLPGREAVALDISRVAGCQVGSERTRKIVDYVFALLSAPSTLGGVE